MALAVLGLCAACNPNGTATTTSSLPSHIVAIPSEICLAPGHAAGFTITNTGLEREWFTDLNGLLVGHGAAPTFSAVFRPSQSETTGPVKVSDTTILAIGLRQLDPNKSAALEVRAPTGRPGIYDVVVFVDGRPPRLTLRVSDKCPSTG